MSIMDKRLTRECGLLSATVEDGNIVISESIVFVLPKSYPFGPPKMLLYSIDHITYLTKVYYTYLPFIKQHNINIECLCCSSIICTWSPCNTCKDVYEEYKSYVKQLKTVLELYIFSKTNLNNDICSVIATFLL
jgi:hypothetical protein